MGYIEKIMGDNERVLYRTHHHVIVLLERALCSLLAFLLFLALGVAFFLSPAEEPDGRIRLIIAVIGFCSLVAPLYLMVLAWMRGDRRRDFLKRVWLPALAGIAILALALTLVLLEESSTIGGWIGIGLSIIPFVVFSVKFLVWLNQRYIITTRRVMEVKGIVNKHARDSALEKVNDVELDQSFIGRILGYGTVQIITGSDIGLNMFRRISNPVRFKRAMLNAKEEIHFPASGAWVPLDVGELAPRESKPTVSVPAGSGAEAAVAGADSRADRSIPDMISELDDLRKRGILTESEFKAKKKELLDRM
jgi:hypothetical protein